ncbi:unnamed protein product [Hymenolepis diminuta]|uniref:Uncharacterized protein n=1 Tax=Hymenolepis diminuta TaxID=6216 RepID=A0A564Z6M6_HYMDI|nr:unnamed protein product [Hymenolepis diminuta]
MPKLANDSKSKEVVCRETGRLDGKLIIVGDANTGIGEETVAELGLRGTPVVIACRNVEKAGAAESNISASYREN